jgi:hypothetical protein
MDWYGITENKYRLVAECLLGLTFIVYDEEDGMNEYCWQDCKYKNICKLNPEQTAECKAAVPKDNLIFGKTWEEIQKMQQKQS